MTKVYFGRPFTGCEYKDVLDYYEKIRIFFTGKNIKPIIPLTGSEGVIEGEIADNVEHFNNPILTDKAIVSRDIWLLKQSDILVMDFSIENEGKFPVGGTMELAMAYVLELHTIVIMKPGAITDRVFIRECADVIFETLDSALAYVKNF